LKFKVKAKMEMAKPCCVEFDEWQRWRCVAVEIIRWECVAMLKATGGK